jgi:hypothetical protein
MRLIPRPERRRTGELLLIRTYSGVLLMFLLKGARPEKYRENWKPGVSPPADHQVKVEFIDSSGNRSSEPPGST